MKRYQFADDQGITIVIQEYSEAEARIFIASDPLLSRYHWRYIGRA